VSGEKYILNPSEKNFRKSFLRYLDDVIDMLLENPALTNLVFTKDFTDSFVDCEQKPEEFPEAVQEMKSFFGDLAGDIGSGQAILQAIDGMEGLDKEKFKDAWLNIGDRIDTVSNRNFVQTASPSLNPYHFLAFKKLKTHLEGKGIDENEIPVALRWLGYCLNMNFPIYDGISVYWSNGVPGYCRSLGKSESDDWVLKQYVESAQYGAVEGWESKADKLTDFQQEESKDVSKAARELLKRGVEGSQSEADESSDDFTSSQVESGRCSLDRRHPTLSSSLESVEGGVLEANKNFVKDCVRRRVWLSKWHKKNSENKASLQAGREKSLQVSLDSLIKPMLSSHENYIDELKRLAKRLKPSDKISFKAFAANALQSLPDKKKDEYWVPVVLLAVAQKGFTQENCFSVHDLLQGRYLPEEAVGFMLNLAESGDVCVTKLMLKVDLPLEILSEEMCRKLLDELKVRDKEKRATFVRQLLANTFAAEKKQEAEGSEELKNRRYNNLAVFLKVLADYQELTTQPFKIHLDVKDTELMSVWFAGMPEGKAFDTFAEATIERLTDDWKNDLASAADDPDREGIVGYLLQAVMNLMDESKWPIANVNYPLRIKQLLIFIKNILGRDIDTKSEVKLESLTALVKAMSQQTTLTEVLRQEVLEVLAKAYRREIETIKMYEIVEEVAVEDKAAREERARLDEDFSTLTNELLGHWPKESKAKAVFTISKSSIICSYDFEQLVVFFRDVLAEHDKELLALNGFWWVPKAPLEAALKCFKEMIQSPRNSDEKSTRFFTALILLLRADDPCMGEEFLDEVKECLGAPATVQNYLPEMLNFVGHKKKFCSRLFIEVLSIFYEVVNALLKKKTHPGIDDNDFLQGREDYTCFSNAVLACLKKLPNKVLEERCYLPSASFEDEYLCEQVKAILLEARLASAKNVNLVWSSSESNTALWKSELYFPHVLRGVMEAESIDSTFFAFLVKTAWAQREKFSTPSGRQKKAGKLYLDFFISHQSHRIQLEARCENDVENAADLMDFLKSSYSDDLNSRKKQRTGYGRS
jgi:hypothetical protein